MNKYEITIITKENPPAGGEPVKKEIESLGGKIGAVNNLGQKQFNFPIKKETAGYYTSVEFELDSQKVIELTKKLSLKNEIIRHLIITAKAVKVEEPVEKKENKEEVTAITEPTDVALDKPKPEEKAISEPLDTALIKPVETAIKEIVEEKPAKKIEEKPEKKTAGKSAKKAEEDAKEEGASTEDRLKALDEKLDELLKE